MATLFNLQAHHEFVQRHGSAVQWKQASLCPCGLEPDPARARPDCYLCGGSGLTYAAPQDMVALVTGIQHEFALLEAGIAEAGDLVLSPSPLETRILSPGDVILLSSFPTGQPFQGELVKRSRAGLVDMLSYPPVVTTRCWTVDQSTRTVREFLTPAHYTVSGRALTWTATAANRPLADQIYSLSYSANVEWVCLPVPMDRRDSANLGPKVLLRARHLMRAA